MTNAWEAAIEYFCGYNQRAERFSVAAKMDATKAAFDRTKAGSLTMRPDYIEFKLKLLFICCSYIVIYDKIN